MKPTRAATAGTIIAVAFVAVAYEAIRTASNTWGSVLRTLSVTILLLSVVAAKFREGWQRAFWLGFAVFGWSAFVLGFNGSTDFFDNMMDSPRTRLNSSWIVSNVLTEIVPIVRKPTNILNEIHPITEKTLDVLHSLMTIVLATCGGSIVVVATRGRGDANELSQPISKKIWVLHVTIIFIILTIIGGSIAGSELRKCSDSSRRRFIPAGMIDESRGLTRDEIEAYTKRLVAARERPIDNLGQTDRDFIMLRFLFVQVSHSICVRIEKTASGAKLRAVVLDDGIRNEPEGIAVEKNMTLTAPQWDELLRRSIKADYWNKASTRRYSRIYGPTVLIEGVKDRKYHAVYRLDDDDENFALFYKYMIELSGIK